MHVPMLFDGIRPGTPGSCAAAPAGVNAAAATPAAKRNAYREIFGMSFMMLTLLDELRANAGGAERLSGGRRPAFVVEGNPRARADERVLRNGRTDARCHRHGLALPLAAGFAAGQVREVAVFSGPALLSEHVRASGTGAAAPAAASPAAAAAGGGEYSGDNRRSDDRCGSPQAERRTKNKR